MVIKFWVSKIIIKPFNTFKKPINKLEVKVVLWLKDRLDSVILEVMEQKRMNKNLQNGIRNQLTKDSQWDSIVYHIILCLELELKKMRRKLFTMLNYLVIKDIHLDRIN